MRETFPGYYHPTDDEFSELWTNCIFVLDANVLLSLYRLSPEASEKLGQVVAQFSDRGQLWVPHQAALEYQRNRRSVIEAQAKACDSVKDVLDNTQRQLREICHDRRPPFLEETDSLLEAVDTAFKEITERLAAWKQERLKLLNADHIRDKIDELLEGRIGSEYPEKRLEEIYKEAELRYSRSIPPGYRAAKKADPNTNEEHLRQYGDVVLWLQVIDHAKETEKPVIFVTNEGREDWWEKSSSGQTIGPRPELIHEMHSKAGVSFYMYRIEPFIEHAGRHLKVEVTEEVLDEARELSRPVDLWTLRRDEMLRAFLEQPVVRHAEMLQRLAQQPALRYAEMLQRWAGQPVIRYDEMLRRLAEQPAFRYDEMLRTLAEQPAFRYQEMPERIGSLQDEMGGAPEGLVEPPSSEADADEEESRLTYRVYENWTVRPDKAIVHRSDCPFANGGPPRPPTKNGRWHGPFATYQEALEAAEGTGREDVRGCKRCGPP